MLKVGARRRLVAAQAGHPGVGVRERAGERLDLAQVAAGVGVALPQPVAVVGGLAAEARALEDLDLDPVALLERAPGRLGLGSGVPINGGAPPGAGLRSGQSPDPGSGCRVD